MSPSIVLLTYGRAPRSTRGLFLRVGGLALLLLAVALMVAAIPRVNRWYEFRRAASYRTSPAAVVYEEHNGPSTLPFKVEGLSDSSGTRQYAAVPEPLRGAGREPPAVLFMGRLQIPGGGEELVVLYLPIHPPSSSRLFVNSFTRDRCQYFGRWTESRRYGREIPGLFGAKGILYAYWFGGTDPRLWSYFDNAAHVLRFYGGQRDPNDPSHFTVDFEADERRVRMHARMQSDATLQLSLEMLSPDVSSPE